MPTIQKRLKTDLVSAIKKRDEGRKSAIRIIMGEFGREREKEIEDARAIKIIKNIIKAEEEGQNDKLFIAICREYLPAELDPKVVEDWVKINIDFSQYKNKMQAMKSIMAHFKGQIDGNVVKSIIEGM